MSFEQMCCYNRRIGPVGEIPAFRIKLTNASFMFAVTQNLSYSGKRQFRHCYKASCWFRQRGSTTPSKDERQRLLLTCRREKHDRPI
jgi:hypothetical protein